MSAAQSALDDPCRTLSFWIVSVLRQKRTIHLLQKRTNLFVDNNRKSPQLPNPFFTLIDKQENKKVECPR